MEVMHIPPICGNVMWSNIKWVTRKWCPLTGLWLYENVCLDKQWPRKLCVPEEQEFNVSCVLSAPFPLFECVTFLAWFLKISSFPRYESLIHACTSLEIFWKPFRNIQKLLLWTTTRKNSSITLRKDQHFRLCGSLTWSWTLWNDIKDIRILINKKVTTFVESLLGNISTAFLKVYILRFRNCNSRLYLVLWWQMFNNQISEGTSFYV